MKDPEACIRSAMEIMELRGWKISADVGWEQESMNLCCPMYALGTVEDIKWQESESGMYEQLSKELKVDVAWCRGFATGFDGCNYKINENDSAHLDGYLLGAQIRQEVLDSEEKGESI